MASDVGWKNHLRIFTRSRYVDALQVTLPCNTTELESCVSILRGARSTALPVDRPTNCAFVGDDASTLSITSARVGLSPAALAETPAAGHLFACDAPCSGMPVAAFGQAPEPPVRVE